LVHITLFINASKKSLEVYQHLSLEAVEDAYQAAVRALEI